MSTPQHPHFVTVQGLLADYLDHDPALITPDTKLADDLSLDSADAIGVMIGVEEVFGIEIADDEIAACRTVSDILALLDRLGATAPAAPEGGAA